MNASLARSNLWRIVQGGATPRILDLYSIRRTHGGDPDHAAKPFFANPRLNSAFILKHTVRPHEREQVHSTNAVITKVLMPVNRDDLGMGGHSLFLEEANFEQRLQEFMGRGYDPDTFSLDMDRLRDLAALPSFDPFILAGRFRNHERPVAECYFALPEKDRQAMESYVGEQIASVVGLALNQPDLAEDDERALKFARQILDGERSARMDVLRMAMSMSEDEFDEGMFGWKGVLYYQWSLDKLRKSLRRFLIEVNDLWVRGVTPAENDQIQQWRRKIISETRNRWMAMQSVMDQYKFEFGRFTSGQDPRAIRRFLLKAPDLFYGIGSDLSAVDHCASYWEYWRKNALEKNVLPAREAMELFPSFISSLARDEGNGVPRHLLD